MSADRTPTAPTTPRAFSSSDHVTTQHRDDRPGLVDLTQLVVQEVERDAPDSDRSWPCPGCGQRHPVADSLGLRVRNRNGNPLERRIRLCPDCFGALEQHAQDPGEPPRATHEPWLQELERTEGIDGAVMRLSEHTGPSSADDPTGATPAKGVRA